jgi:hypothetical protein
MGTKTGEWLIKDNARPEEGKNNDFSTKDYP